MILIDRFEDASAEAWRIQAAISAPVLIAATGILGALVVIAACRPVWAEGSTAAASVQAATRPAFPVIDPATALAGETLLKALQKGGFVLYMRHMETGPITEQCNASNLSPAGAKVARELGLKLKQLRIPVGRVVSSPVCRVQETAKLLDMGEVELSNDLAQAVKPPTAELYAARMRQLAQPPRPGTNTLAVSHTHGGVPRHQTMDLEFGEVIVFQIDGARGIKPVARIRAEDWQALDTADRPSARQ